MEYIFWNSICRRYNALKDTRSTNRLLHEIEDESDYYNMRVNNKKCKFIILNDTLFEKRYLQNNTYKTENLKSFKIYSIDDSIGAHSVQNLDDRIKWSIHKYK